MKNYYKMPLLASAVSSLGYASSALAQVAGASSDVPPSNDIIVTAQRRSERLRDVPISITALSGETLAKAGITNTLDLGKVTPGVVLPLYGAFVLPSIRGISSSGSAVGDSPNVAVYVDGVYQANQSAQIADLPDVQSIQVLKGPQGSLYGQNAAGGAIIIDTVMPSFTWTGKLLAGYGNYDDKSANGYVAGPISSTLAFALSGAYRDRGGVNVDLLRGGHDNGLRARQLRGKLLWEPSETLSTTLSAYYTRHDDTGIYSISPINGRALGNSILSLPCNFGGLACLNLPQATKPHEFAMSPAPDSRTKTHGVNLSTKVAIGEVGTLNLLSSYNDTNVLNFSDIDGTLVNGVDFRFRIKERDFLQEINFVSANFRGLSVTAGLFYLNKIERYAPNTSNAYSRNASGLFNTAYPSPLSDTPIYAITAKYKKQSYAAYAELTYDITDTISVIAAGRYSSETVKAFNTRQPAGWQYDDPLVDPAPDPRGSFTFKKFTPRTVVRYRPDGNNTLYASYSQGFKSGYVNTSNINACTPQPTCIDAPVDPETVDAYEIGYKARLLDGKVDLNLAAFHYKYKSIQVFVFVPGPPPISSFQNAAAGKVNGAEFNAAYRMTPDLTFSLGGAYLDAHYIKFTNATVFVPAAFGANVQTAANVSGNRLMRTPKFTGNASINYTWQLPGGDLAFYVGANYNSGIYFDPLNRVRQKAYALVDGELSYSPKSMPGLRFALWGKNLTNHDYLQGMISSQFLDAGSYADPRTYGGRVEFRF